jgi:hypothetical protein
MQETMTESKSDSAKAAQTQNRHAKYLCNRGTDALQACFVIVQRWHRCLADLFCGCATVAQALRRHVLWLCNGGTGALQARMGLCNGGTGGLQACFVFVPFLHKHFSRIYIQKTTMSLTCLIPDLHYE